MRNSLNKSFIPRDLDLANPARIEKQTFSANPRRHRFVSDCMQNSYFEGLTSYRSAATDVVLMFCWVNLLACAAALELPEFLHAAQKSPQDDGR